MVSTKQPQTKSAIAFLKAAHAQKMVNVEGKTNFLLPPNQMNTTMLEAPRNVIATRPPVVPHTDITRGAGHFGIRNQKVMLATEVLDDYREIDRALGYNTVGLILSVLARHIAATPGGGRDDSFAVCLHRQENDHDVEVHFTLSRSRRAGQECLLVYKLADREIE